VLFSAPHEAVYLVEVECRGQYRLTSERCGEDAVGLGAGLADA
jgi:hypothetical protein